MMDARELSLQVQRVEDEKLRAVGLRNRVATLEEVGSAAPPCIMLAHKVAGETDCIGVPHWL
jgi:hypothetical protein